MMRRFLVVLLLASAGEAAEAASANAVCLDAADRAAARHDVPARVMRALTRTETGRNRGGALQPWPWTSNIEGEGAWHGSRAEAVASIEQARRRGARSFDVGCFQLNHVYHSKTFDDINHMIDPYANADYAARFVKSLFQEYGDWPSAAGAYHSRTPRLMDRYRKRFEQVLARGERDDSGAELALAQPGVIKDAPRPARAVDADAPAAGKRPKSAPWRLSEAVAPRTPGAVSMKFGRGRGPLLGAARPLIE